MNAGGIIGAIQFESDMDPEEDISISGDTTLNAVGNLRSVILNCHNKGTVTAKNQRIGGIVGWLSMGLTKDCTNTGKIDNPASDYVGGIAGDSAGYIRNCNVKAIVSGDAFVGGIAGRGAVLSDNYAMVNISGTENIGCILGGAVEPHNQADDPIGGNFYLQFASDYGGIDGISYQDQAQGLYLDDFLQQAAHPMFEQVTVTFIANGKVVLQVTQSTGSSFQAIPDVPVSNGYTGSWNAVSDIDLNYLLFDVNIEATYIAYSTVIQTDETDESGKPILLLQGDFSVGATASVTVFESFSVYVDYASHSRVAPFGNPRI